MFTLKWVAANGSQTLYSGVDEVNYSPATETESKKSTVSFRTNGVHCSIDAGRIYVMNQDGKTVERYFLEGDPEWPHGLVPAA